MCPTIQISYLLTGAESPTVIIVEGVFNGVNYNYSFSIDTNPGGEPVLVDYTILFIEGKVFYWSLVETVPGYDPQEVGTLDISSSCPEGDWKLTTKYIVNLTTGEFILGQVCSPWSNEDTLGLPGTLGNYVFKLDSAIEEYVAPGIYLDSLTSPFPIAQYQQPIIQSVVYISNDNSTLYTQPGPNRSFLGVILRDAATNTIIEYQGLNFLVLGTLDNQIIWDYTTVNNRKSFTFYNNFTGAFSNIYWAPAPVEADAPFGTSCWILQDVASGNYQGFNFDPSTDVPTGTFFSKFEGETTRYSTETYEITGDLCLRICPPVEDNCFELLVWEKQCEFSKCVLDYIHGLMFGNVDCHALENLKLQRRVLEILNCYDSRDIEENTVLYNNLEYNTIKKLINK